MSFAGFMQIVQVCHTRNLQNFEISLASLRSHTKACLLMSFAGLQVCFQSESRKHVKHPLLRRNQAFFHIYERRESHA